MTLPEEITELVASDRRPFPYEDCRRLLAANPGEYKDLIPDLDQYFSMIAGYASSASLFDRWEQTRLGQARSDISNSFFEDHPEYDLLRPEINLSDTPHLHDRLELYETLRQLLLRLMSEAQIEQRA